MSFPSPVDRRNALTVRSCAFSHNLTKSQLHLFIQKFPGLCGWWLFVRLSARRSSSTKGYFSLLRLSQYVWILSQNRLDFRYFQTRRFRLRRPISENRKINIFCKIYPNYWDFPLFSLAYLTISVGKKFSANSVLTRWLLLVLSLGLSTSTVSTYLYREKKFCFLFFFFSFSKGVEPNILNRQHAMPCNNFSISWTTNEVE